MPKVAAKSSAMMKSSHTTPNRKNGKTICEVPDCHRGEKSYSNPTDLSRHKWRHLPPCLLPRCPFENCDFVYNGRSGSLAKHWTDHHANLSIIGQPFPQYAIKSLRWPLLEEILAHHQIALGEHPADPVPEYEPITYPQQPKHMMRRSKCTTACCQFPTASSVPVASPTERRTIRAPSPSYVPMDAFPSPISQYYTMDPYPVPNQATTSYGHFVPPPMEYVAMPVYSTFSSSFSTLDGPYPMDIPVWNKQIEYDMFNNGIIDFSALPPPPPTSEDPFNLQPAWDYYQESVIPGYY